MSRTGEVPVLVSVPVTRTVESSVTVRGSWPISMVTGRSGSLLAAAAAAPGGAAAADVAAGPPPFSSSTTNSTRRTVARRQANAPASPDRGS